MSVFYKSYAQAVSNHSKYSNIVCRKAGNVEQSLKIDLQMRH